MSDAYDEEEEGGGIAGFFRGLFKSRESEPEKAAPPVAPLGKLSARERLAALQKAKAAGHKPEGASGADSGGETPAGPAAPEKAPSQRPVAAPAAVAPAAEPAAPVTPAQVMNPVPPPPPAPKQGPSGGPMRVPADMLQVAERLAALEKALAAEREKRGTDIAAVAGLFSTANNGLTLEARKNAAETEWWAMQSTEVVAEISRLKERLHGLEAYLLTLPAIRETAKTTEARFGVVTGRIASLEQALNKLALQLGLREKLESNSAAALGGRLRDLETGSVPLAEFERHLAQEGGVARELQRLQTEHAALARTVSERPETASGDLAARLERLEQESARLRKTEAALEAACKKMVSLEAAQEALLAEQAKAAEMYIQSGSAIEELRVRFKHMSVVFDHIRRPLEDVTGRIISAALGEKNGRETREDAKKRPGADGD